MHHFTYAFLSQSSLPENLHTLLSCLHREGVAKKKPSQTTVQLDGISPETYAQILDQIAARDSSLPLETDELLNIYRTLLPSFDLDIDQERSLQSAVSAYHQAIETDSLLLIPCFALDTICIFSDIPGAQNAALAVVRLLLHISGFCTFPFLEEYVHRYQYFYQHALDKASVHWQIDGSDYFCYIEIFLSLLYLSREKRSRELPIRSRGFKRAAVEKMVLEATKPISKAEICAALPQISPTTVEAVLGAMVRAGTAQRVGATRSARYIKA